MDAREAITKRVDHIMIRVVEEQYEPLFSLLTQTLQLPMAWPINADVPGFKTGGVFAGTISMEIFQSGSQQTLLSLAPSQAQLYGIALEPYEMGAALQEVDRRDIPHLPLMPVPEGAPLGTMGSMWTLLFFGGLLGSDLSRYEEVMKGSSDLAPFFSDLYRRGTIFLCEYTKRFYDTTRGRIKLQAELRTRQGGPLGLLGVREIVVGAQNIEAAREDWQRLLDPIQQTEPELWQVGDGPALRLVPQDQDGLVRLIWQVASLDRAAAFLREQNLLQSFAGGAIVLDRARLYGLDIRLITDE